MVPSLDDVRLAAFFRWEHRGYSHGRDREDWLAAEQDAWFLANYRIVARHRLDGESRVLGDDAARCRFCERPGMHGDVAAAPGSLGGSLRTREVCDECAEAAREATDGALDRFSRPFRTGSADAWGGSIPIAAYKALARVALTLLPEDELDAFPDAIEWVVNTDHDLDGGTLGPLACIVTLLDEPAPHPWAAAAVRTDDDAPVPYLLGFVGSGRAAFQVTVPLCTRDDDLDGKALVVPRPSPTLVAGHGHREGVAITLPMASEARGARRRFAFA